MGILLTFMFLWNMVGALVLIPALSYFLLPGPRRSTETTITKGAGDAPVAGSKSAIEHSRERLAGT
jgi:hypothetical protein